MVTLDSFSEKVSSISTMFYSGSSLGVHVMGSTISSNSWLLESRMVSICLWDANWHRDEATSVLWHSRVGVTKRTGGTTKHQRQHHAQCCNGHQTHSMPHGAQPVVWIHLGHETTRGHVLLIPIVLYYCLPFRALCVSISAFSDVRVRTFMTWRWFWPVSPWPLYVICDTCS